VPKSWRQALDCRTDCVVALAQAEWAAWSDPLLLEWDDERLVVRERFPNLSRDDAGWIAWARVRVGFSERRGGSLDDYRRQVRVPQRGREAAKPGIAA